MEAHPNKNSKNGNPRKDKCVTGLFELKPLYYLVNVTSSVRVQIYISKMSFHYV